MIFERYSGSDRSGGIPRRYARFLGERESLSLEERCSFFEKLLRKERDPSWRGFWRYCRALEYFDTGRKDELVAHLEQALAEFDLLSASFPDVESEYAHALRLLLQERHIPSGDLETSLEYALRLMPHLEAMEPGSHGRFEVYCVVGDALLRAAQDKGSEVYCRAAVDFLTAAHHIEPDEPGALASLAYAYDELGDPVRARAAYAVFTDLGVPYDQADRLHAFCRERPSTFSVPSSHDPRVSHRSFERYSGSDTSGQLPRRFARFLHEMDKLTLEERVSFLTQLLEEEQDPNWRASWRVHLAIQHRDSGPEDELVSGLKMALEEFDQLEANFTDVESDYAMCLWYLMACCCGPAEPIGTRLEHALRVLPHLEAGHPDLEDRADVYHWASQALRSAAKEKDDRGLYRVAVDYAAAAHHAEPEDPGILESLVYAYYGAGDLERAARVYSIFKDLGLPYEYSDRLHEFCRRAFPAAPTGPHSRPRDVGVFLALVAGIFALVFAGQRLFRTAESSNDWGLVRDKYTWGRLSRSTYDVNRDGRVDIEVTYGPSAEVQGLRGTRILEFWESTRLDGTFNLHYSEVNGTPRVDVDTNRDGRFDERHDGDAANVALRSFASRFRAPLTEPTPAPSGSNLSLPSHSSPKVDPPAK